MKKRILKKLKQISKERLEKLGDKGIQNIIDTQCFKSIVRKIRTKIIDEKCSKGFRYEYKKKIKRIPNGVIVDIPKLMFRRVKKEYARGIITI